MILMKKSVYTKPKHKMFFQPNVVLICGIMLLVGSFVAGSQNYHQNHKGLSLIKID